MSKFIKDTCEKTDNKNIQIMSKLLLTSILINVNEAIKPCRSLQFLNKNEINN